MNAIIVLFFGVLWKSLFSWRFEKRNFSDVWKPGFLSEIKRVLFIEIKYKTFTLRKTNFPNFAKNPTFLDVWKTAFFMR